MKTTTTKNILYNAYLFSSCDISVKHGQIHTVSIVNCLSLKTKCLQLASGVSIKNKQRDDKIRKLFFMYGAGPKVN
jgi:hypothetical protein